MNGNSIDGMIQAITTRKWTMAAFEATCKGRGITVLEDAKPNENQEAMQVVVTSMQGIVEVCARGTRRDYALAWRQDAEVALSRLGIPI